MLAIEGLNAHYGASHVLQGVDTEVPGGTIVSVLGRNGVGKTTTVRAIMELVPASSGRVCSDGQDIAAWPPHRVARAGTAYVPEGRLIFPQLTVIEKLFASPSRKRVNCGLRRVLAQAIATRRRRSTTRRCWCTACTAGAK